MGVYGLPILVTEVINPDVLAGPVATSSVVLQQVIQSIWCCEDKCCRVDINIFKNIKKNQNCILAL